MYYVVYWSFGQQASALPLMPLATAGLVAMLTAYSYVGLTLPLIASAASPRQ